MAKKLTRKQLKQPDEFVTTTGKALQYLLARKKEVAVAAAIFIVFLLAGSSWRIWKMKTETKALISLERALASYERYGEEQSPKTAHDKAKAEFEAMFSEFSNSSATKFGKILYADMAYRAGDYDAAENIYKELAVDSGDPSYIKTSAINGLAYCSLQKKDMERAGEFFNSVERAGQSPLEADALFNLGLIRSAGGDKGKGAEYFKRLLSNHGDSIFADMARDKVAEFSDGS